MSRPHWSVLPWKKVNGTARIQGAEHHTQKLLLLKGFQEDRAGHRWRSKVQKNARASRTLIHPSYLTRAKGILAKPWLVSFYAALTSSMACGHMQILSSSVSVAHTHHTRHVNSQSSFPKYKIFKDKKKANPKMVKENQHVVIIR